MRSFFIHGQVYTGQLPLVEAFGVEDGRFIFAGSTQEALALCAEGDTVTDLEGQFVCSGFTDSHMHLLNYGEALSSPLLAEHTDSLSDMLAYLRIFIAEHKGRGGWIIGRGWNQDYFKDVHRLPNRYDLDTVAGDIPLLIIRCCGHCLVVNSKALELLGLDENTPCPEGGRIGMADGRLDGVFYDNAMDAVYSRLPVPSKEELKEMIRTGSRALNAYGVTGCHSDDFSAFSALPWQTVVEAYRELEEAGEMTVRVYSQNNFSSPDTLKEFVEAGYKTGVGSELYRFGPLKMLGDGSLGARTAFLSAPYSDDPSTCGFPCFSQETMDRMIGYANSVGMQVAVHAIGDACLDMVLNAVERALTENPRSDHRHGVVHCQITRADQLERLAKLQMHIYAQSIFLDYDNHIVAQRVGTARAETSYSWKTLMDAGLSVSNGTDCPVELPDALAGIQCAVTRTSLRDGVGPYLPEQAFSVQEAIDSYTIHSAEASFEESCRGRICPGFLADFVVLEKNLFEIPADTIRNVKVCATYMGGRRVF